MSWPADLLGNVSEVVTGSTPSKKKPEYYGDIIPFITPSELNDSEISNPKVYLSNEGAEVARVLPVDSVLVCCIGSLGKVGYARKEMATNQQINSLIFDTNKVYPRFGYHYCKTLKPLLDHIGPSTTVAIVNKSRFSELSIPLPPLKEQKRIAAILDKADAIRRKRQQAIDLTDQLLRSVFLDMFGDPVMNPKGWDVVPVGKVTGCIVPGRDKPKSFSGDTSWVTTKDLEHLGITMQPKDFIGLSDEEIKEVKAKVIPENSVLMTCVGDLGVISIAGVPMVINQQLHAFQCGKELDSQFLMFALSFQKAFMLKMASSTTVHYMNKAVCNSVPVIIPPVVLQNKFSDVAIKIRQSLRLKNESENSILDLFSSLTQQAFNGELSKQAKAA